MNHRVMAFPYLMYLASIGTCSSPVYSGGDMLTNTTGVVLGIASIYYSSEMRHYTVTNTNITTSYYSISLSLNVLLTLMIVIRLIMHIRNIRNAIGASDGSGGLHTVAPTVIMMLIESYALYAGVLLAYIILWAVNSWVVNLLDGAIAVSQARIVFTIHDAVLVCRLIQLHAGHRSISDHSSSRQAKSNDERIDLWECRVHSFQEPRVGWRQWIPS